MLAFYTRCQRDYGDVVSYRVGPRRHILLNDPDLIEEVLVAQNRNFIKHYAFRLLRPVLGNGVLLSDGDFWLRQRRLMQPAFGRRQIDGFVPIIVELTARLLDTWRDGQARDLHDDMTKLALDIVSKTLLDVEAGDKSAEVSRAVDGIMQDFNSRFQSALPLPFWLPAPRNRRLRAHVRLLDGVIHGIIQQRRGETRERGDLLSLLMRARDEEDQTGMTDAQLRDEAMNLFLAGHETTANLLSWTWYLLATHPEVEGRLLAELAGVLAGRLPTAADVPKLHYTEQVVLETLRLYPPAYATGREALGDCMLGGYRIHRGMTVILSQWVMHRHPKYFERPDEFDPDRWRSCSEAGGQSGKADGHDELLKRLPKYAYFPFGGGPRICIGNSFAMLEAMLAVATVIPRYGFTLAAQPPVETWPSVTLRPRHGIHVVVHSRAGALDARQQSTPQSAAQTADNDHARS
jgi:cytochrome P450